MKSSHVMAPDSQICTEYLQSRLSDSFSGGVAVDEVRLELLLVATLLPAQVAAQRLRVHMHPHMNSIRYLKNSINKCEMHIIKWSKLTDFFRLHASRQRMEYLFGRANPGSPAGEPQKIMNDTKRALMGRTIKIGDGIG